MDYDARAVVESDKGESTEGRSWRQLYSVYDRLAGEYGPLFEAVNHAVAVRQFKRLTKDMQTPEDYLLVFIGRRDVVHGRVKPNDTLDVIE